MANINEILARAAALRDETALNSISPERAGGIMYDTLLALNELWLQQGAALVISKIYASVAAMEADTAPVSDLTGKPLRPGQIVVIASSDSDNGSVYRYNGTESPSWSLVGSIGNLDPVDSLDSDSTTLPLAAHQGKVLDGKISQLGQNIKIELPQVERRIGVYLNDGTRISSQDGFVTNIFKISILDVEYMADFRTINNNPEYSAWVSVSYFDEDGNFIGYEYGPTTSASSVISSNNLLHIPENTAFIGLLSRANEYTVAKTYSFELISPSINGINTDIDEINTDIDGIKSSTEDKVKNIPASEEIYGLYQQDGTIYEVAHITKLYKIEFIDFKYIADFKTIVDRDVYSNCVSVAYLNKNKVLIGYDYPASGSSIIPLTNIELQDIPVGTVYIGLYAGANGAANYSKLVSHESVNQRLDFLENSLIDNNESFKHFYDVIPYSGRESGMIKSDGTIDTTKTGEVYSFNINPKCKYCIDALYVTDSGYVSVAYYTNNGVFISSQIPPKVSDNDLRKYCFNFHLTVPINASVVKCQRDTSDGTKFGSILRKYSDVSVLFGKKIAVLGDSISTDSEYTTPYFRVTENDVSQNIQSFVTSEDVDNSLEIGGVPVTNAMVDGQLHQFTPSLGDVGKSIGVPRITNGGNNILVWQQVFARLVGARVVANASYSGSAITSCSEGNYASWKPYSVNRCTDYSPLDYSQKEIPDIIIVYRGTNDFIHTDYEENARHLTLNSPDLFDGLDYNSFDNDFVNSEYVFKQAYLVTINKLRELYPKALIVVASLNIIKRVIYDTFPTRNFAHTFPDFSNAIRDVANIAGCPIIELDKDGITFQNCYSEGYITDSSTTPTHPAQKGHWTMGLKAASDLQYYLATQSFNI